MLREVNNPIYVGLDVGSTTVKAVVMNNRDDILWKSYRRHNARQPELVLEFLTEIECRFAHHDLLVFTTGNGGRSIASHVNGVHVQEVNAVTVAVEKRHPRAGAAIELGGQDAKIILWKSDRAGRKTTLSFMNDKCAGGTGATLDKIFSKIHLTPDDIQNIRAENTPVHHVAAKCGVFAETDVVGLMKAGVKEEEIVVSLCNAVVKQNIEVLLHGNLLRTDILLLGGPHTYYRVFETLWRRQIPKTWRLHGWSPPKRPMEELIFVPPDAEYFAALGAILIGRESASRLPKSLRHQNTEKMRYEGTQKLIAYIEAGKAAQLEAMGTVNPGLVHSEAERLAFVDRFAVPAFEPKDHPPGSNLPVLIGLDGGSTTSKIAVVATDGHLLYKDYLLSKGNPIVDMREMFARLDAWLKVKDINFSILGTGVTGYASEILQKAFDIDVGVVETVAHLKSAEQYCGDVDVICDVGGQDIKVLFMKHRRVVDIKLNTQCSAGNGYFLQSMASQFGIPMEGYADAAFSARKAPSFNYGCAVFMEQDKVNFQQMGWSKEEIMAGLALVLPLNIWNYVVQETNLRRLGTRFLLQGGTQKNLAAVKAQVDFIKGRVPGAKVMVHANADIAGAVGAALEARQTHASGPSRFIGIEAAANISFITQNSQATECRFCANHCKRTFIDIDTPKRGATRYISGHGCEKGAADNITDMRQLEREKNALLEACPNLVTEAARAVFETYAVAPATPNATSAQTMLRRKNMVIGIPKLLNLFVYAPFFNAYFRSLGIGRVVYSDDTSQKLWAEGNKWGAVDPCFPAKVAPAHIYNLLKREEVTHICFPMITHLESMVENTLGNNACVIQMGTTEVVHAAFTKNQDFFAKSNKPFLKPLVRMDRPAEAAGSLLGYFGERLDMSAEENDRAVAAGYKAVETYLARLRHRGAEIINHLVTEDKIGILFLGHPYHHDPGLNHGILEAFQLKGYPVLCIESLPVTEQFLAPLFNDTRASKTNPFDISDVWQRCFNRNTNAKIWAAKVAARHPNLAVIDISSFKCGHDAPTYSYVSRILDASETPHFLFHDIDQNKPTSTLKIRIESIDYFLKKEEERLRQKVSAIQAWRKKA